MLPSLDHSVSKAKKIHFANTNSFWMIMDMKAQNYDFLMTFHSQYESHEHYLDQPTRVYFVRISVSNTNF